LKTDDDEEEEKKQRRKERIILRETDESGQRDETELKDAIGSFMFISKKKHCFISVFFR